MKIIMPMARLATVSVTQVLPEPIKGSMTTASIIGSNSGTKSWAGFGRASDDARSVTGAPPG